MAENGLASRVEKERVGIRFATSGAISKRLRPLSVCVPFLTFPFAPGASSKVALVFR